MYSILTTDGYKFAMAQAGFPLREETFYLSFRKGGWQYVPFDLEAWVQTQLFPDPREPEDCWEYAAENGYELNSAMKKALRSSAIISAVPKGCWVYEREPILTIRGPSFLVSWLEPLILRLFFPIQLATELKLHGKSIDDACLLVTCEEQKTLVEEVIDAVCPSFKKDLVSRITIDSERYMAGVTNAAQSILEVVKDPSRVFEVGMRAATCEEQHMLALRSLNRLRIEATSNVALARTLDMIPVGTMGHEHVQRWGNDLSAFRAMRDMREGSPSYLLDTFDTITSGIPSAIQAMSETLSQECSIRYDSGDKFGQYMFAHGEFLRKGLHPTHILEDGLTAEDTRKFESLREHTGIPPRKQLYGYGGFLVSRHWPNPLSRDRVAAVYKLSETSGEPRMKFGNESGLGKQSIPGVPVTWRRTRGNGPLSVIAQAGEETPEDYIVLNGNPESTAILRICNVRCEGKQPYTLSEKTKEIIQTLK